MKEKKTISEIVANLEKDECKRQGKYCSLLKSSLFTLVVNVFTTFNIQIVN